MLFLDILRLIPAVLENNDKPFVLYSMSPLSFLTCHRQHFLDWASYLGPYLDRILVVFHGTEFESESGFRKVRRNVKSLTLFELYEVLNRFQPQHSDETVQEVANAMELGCLERVACREYGQRNESNEGLRGRERRDMDSVELKEKA